MGIISSILTALAIILVFGLLIYSFIKAPTETWEYVKGIAIRAYEFVRYTITEGIKLFKIICKT